MKQGEAVQKRGGSRITAGLVLLLLPAIATAGEVTLAWDANSETNLAGYKLYYDGDSDTETYDGIDANEGDSPVVIYLEDLADSDAPTYTLTGLTGGEYYCFCLTAFNSDGLESDYSDEVGVSIEEATSLSSPEAEQSVPSSGDTETDAADDTGSDASGGGCFIQNILF